MLEAFETTQEAKTNYAAAYERSVHLLPDHQRGRRVEDGYCVWYRGRSSWFIQMKRSLSVWKKAGEVLTHANQVMAKLATE